MGPSLKDLGRIVAEQRKEQKAKSTEQKPQIQKKGRDISYHKHTEAEKRHNQPIK